jgi:hypothetical protein
MGKQGNCVFAFLLMLILLIVFIGLYYSLIRLCLTMSRYMDARANHQLINVPFSCLPDISSTYFAPCSDYAKGINRRCMFIAHLSSACSKGLRRMTID